MRLDLRGTLLDLSSLDFYNRVLVANDKSPEFDCFHVLCILHSEKFNIMEHAAQC